MMHVLVVYSYFALKIFEEFLFCKRGKGCEAGMNEGPGDGLTRLVKSYSLHNPVLHHKAPEKHNRLFISRFLYVSVDKPYGGNYSAMICYLFLNKNKIPNIQKIILTTFVRGSIFFFLLSLFSES